MHERIPLHRPARTAAGVHDRSLVQTAPHAATSDLRPTLQRDILRPGGYHPHIGAHGETCGEVADAGAEASGCAEELQGRHVQSQAHKMLKAGTQTVRRREAEEINPPQGEQVTNAYLTEALPGCGCCCSCWCWLCLRRNALSLVASDNHDAPVSTAAGSGQRHGRSCHGERELGQL